MVNSPSSGVAELDSFVPYPSSDILLLLYNLGSFVMEFNKCLDFILLVRESKRWTNQDPPNGGQNTLKEASEKDGLKMESAHNLTNYAQSKVDDWLQFWDWALSISDPRVKDWLFMGSVWPTVYLTIAYILVSNLGPKIMESRKPYDLKPFMVRTLTSCHLCMLHNAH